MFAARAPITQLHTVPVDGASEPGSLASSCTVSAQAGGNRCYITASCTVREVTVSCYIRQ